jgi:phosphate uptake regulator
MLRTILNLFKRESLIDQAYSDIIIMLKEDEEMFAEAIRSLRYSDTAELRFDFREKDRKINKFEREVRKKVLTHLSLLSGSDVPAALVLTSIVIDVERIGDFCKNIADCARLHPMRLLLGEYEMEYNKIEEAIHMGFKTCIKALEDFDIDLARQILADHKGISKFCDLMNKRLVQGKVKDLECGEYASLALYTRYLKRTAAHLSNIASSVVNPFHRIGFKPKDMHIEKHLKRAKESDKK